MNGTKMKNYKIIAGLISFAAVFGVSNAANAKSAKCDIIWYGSRYVGPCDFTSGKKGSFDIDLPGDTYRTHDVPNSIYMYVTSPGRGVVGWIAPTGRLLEASEPVRRDPRKPACWAGDEFRICAYQSPSTVTSPPFMKASPR